VTENDAVRNQEVSVVVFFQERRTWKRQCCDPTWILECTWPMARAFMSRDRMDLGTQFPGTWIRVKRWRKTTPSEITKCQLFSWFREWVSERDCCLYLNVLRRSRSLCRQNSRHDYPVQPHWKTQLDTGSATVKILTDESILTAWLMRNHLVQLSRLIDET
jgi:hypothetical protein